MKDILPVPRDLAARVNASQGRGGGSVEDVLQVDCHLARYISIFPKSFVVDHC